jgi:hypothetical protein
MIRQWFPFIMMFADTDESTPPANGQVNAGPPVLGEEPQGPEEEANNLEKM